MTTNNLTEQWKRGELEEGEYYIKSNKGDIYIDICANGSFMFTNYKSVEEVLAEVPDYIEWKNYVTMYNYEHEENKQLKQWVEEFNVLNVAQENQKLKELLKECKETIETSVWGNCSELTDQIDEVLK